jgi:hypothetical protein
METWALRPASHLASSLLRHCIDKENLPPKILRTPDPPLVIRTPLVSAPATNRARTLRKDISSLDTGVATVRQAYNGRPVRPGCRLLRFFFGGVCLGLHLYFLPWVWLPHQCQAPPSLAVCIIYYNYTTRRAQGVATLRLGLRVVIRPQGPGRTQEKSRAALWRGEIQRAACLAIKQIVVPRRTQACTPNGVSLYARWLLSQVFGVGQSEGSEPCTVGAPTHDRSRCASTGEVVACFLRCARPTEGRYVRTTEGSAQRFKGAKRRPGSRRTPDLWPPMRLSVDSLAG